MNVDYDYVATKFMLMVFKILGLMPYTIKKSSRSILSKKRMWKNIRIQFSSSRLGCLYNLLLVAIEIFILYTVVLITHSDSGNRPTVLTEFIVTGATFIAHTTQIFIYLMLAFRQEEGVLILNRLLNMDGTIILENANGTCKSGRCFFILVLLTNISFFIGAAICYPEEWNSEAVLTLFRIKFPNFIISCFVTQYIFLIKVIYYRLRAFHHVLRFHQDFSLTNPANEFYIVTERFWNVKLASKIKSFRRIHENLYQIASDASAFYSLPILFVIAHLSLNAVCSVYYVCVILFMMDVKSMNELIKRAVHVAIMGVGSSLPIFILTSAITRLNDEIFSMAVTYIIILIQHQAAHQADKSVTVQNSSSGNNTLSFVKL